MHTKSKRQIKILQSDIDAKSMELKALTEKRDATKTHIIKFGEEMANLKKENGELKAQVAEQIADHFGVAQTEILNLEKEISGKYIVHNCFHCHRSYYGIVTFTSYPTDAIANFSHNNLISSTEHQSQMVKYRNKIERHQHEMNNLRGSESATAGEGGDAAAPVAPAE